MASYFRLFLWWFCALEAFDVYLTHLKRSRPDYMTQILHRITEEDTSAYIQCDSDLLNDGEDLINVTEEFLNSVRIYYEIVKINQINLPVELGENNTQCSLESYLCIGEAR